MPERLKKTNDIEGLDDIKEPEKANYDTLEFFCDEIVEKLSDPEIGLDEATTCYRKALRLTNEMETRITQLMTNLRDDIKME